MMEGGPTDVERVGFEAGDKVGKWWFVAFLSRGGSSSPSTIDSCWVSEEHVAQWWPDAASRVGLCGGRLQCGEPSF